MKQWMVITEGLQVGKGHLIKSNAIQSAQDYAISHPNIPVDVYELVHECVGRVSVKELVIE